MRWILSGLLPAVLLALPAGATTLRIATRAAWEAAVGASFVTEDFESVPLQEAPVEGGTISTTWFDILIPENHGEIGVFDRGGSRVFVGDLHNFGTPDRILLEFHQPILAFAVDVLFVEDDDPDIAERIRFSTAEAAFEVPSLTFLGLTSDVPFTSVEIRVGGDYFAFFDLDQVSAVIPEPATALLVASGLAGLARARRRRHGGVPAR